MRFFLNHCQIGTVIELELGPIDTMYCVALVGQYRIR